MKINDKKQILKVILAIMLIYGIAYLIKKKSRIIKKLIAIIKSSSNKSQKQLSNNDKNKQNLLYESYYFDKQKAIKNIKIYIQQNNFNVKNIYFKSPEIVKEQFIKFTIEMRKRRRLIRTVNQSLYIKQIRKYHQQIQELLTRSRLQLLEGLQINCQTFTQLQQSQNIDDLVAFHRKSQQILKKTLITDIRHKIMSKQKLNQIIQYQIQFIQNKIYNHIKIQLEKEEDITQRDILNAIYTVLQDHIYIEFGYETQDIESKIQQIGYNTKKRDKIRNQIHRQISNLTSNSSSKKGNNNGREMNGKQLEGREEKKQFKKCINVEPLTFRT